MRDKRIKPLLKKLSAQGWTIHPIKKGWMCIPPDVTKPAVTIHKTPSDAKWFETCKRLLKRSGYRE